MPPSTAQAVAASGAGATVAVSSLSGATGGNGTAPPVTGAPLRIQTHRTSDRATLVLSGELDPQTIPVLRAMLEDIERDAPPLIVVDLRELRFMDSSGLGELVHADRRARAERRRVVLVTGSAPIDRILLLSGVTGTSRRPPTRQRWRTRDRSGATRRDLNMPQARSRSARTA